MSAHRRTDEKIQGEPNPGRSGIRDIQSHPLPQDEEDIQLELKEAGSA